MTTPGDNKLTVRVEVVIEGAQTTSLTATTQKGRATVQPRAGTIKPRMIDSPSSGVEQTVVTMDGSYFIPANGSKLGGSPSTAASVVYALVYAGTDVDPPSEPGAGAVTDVPLDDGSWAFNLTSSLVPCPLCDSSGEDNCTLVVWYDFPNQPGYVIESTTFPAYCSSSGAGGDVVTVGSRLMPAKLHATFTGALSGLSTVLLTWNGAAWVGVSSCCGGSMLSLLCLDQNFHLTSAGPGPAFSVSGPAISFAPLTWSTTGTAFGARPGAFGVTVTE